jgi:hypothetical protein
VRGDTITGQYAAAQGVLDAVEAQGVSYIEVVEVLETRGRREVREGLGLSSPTSPAPSPVRDLQRGIHLG